MLERITEMLFIFSYKVDGTLQSLGVTFSYEPDKDLVALTCASDYSAQTCLNSLDDPLDEV